MIVTCAKTVAHGCKCMMLTVIRLREDSVIIEPSSMRMTVNANMVFQHVG